MEWLFLSIVIYVYNRLTYLNYLYAIESSNKIQALRTIISQLGFLAAVCPFSVMATSNFSTPPENGWYTHAEYYYPFFMLVRWNQIYLPLTICWKTLLILSSGVPVKLSLLVIAASFPVKISLCYWSIGTSWNPPIISYQ